jgi:hypothetical protein
MLNKLIIDEYGTKKWYQNGELHREDGPAREYSDGDKEWYFNGKRHREGGPAVEYDKRKYWYQNDLLHRKDGPAVEYDEYQGWWYKGEQIDCKTNEEFLRLIKLRLFW